MKLKRIHRFSLVALLFSFVLFPSIGISGALLEQHSPRPFQAEGNYDALLPWETPIAGFFVRSHHDIPVVDESKWILKIDGLVDKPMTLTLNDLRKMKKKSLHAVLECSGNGRGMQSPKVPGVQWQEGAVGNAEWTGISVSELLKAAGVKAEARFATVEGADQPAFATVPRFIRSIPMDKILHSDTLIAFQMNRQSLPILHGGPLRLVLPGWYGENWMKWLTHITLTAEEDQGFYMKKAYRMPSKDSPLPIEQLRVQSIIVSPREGKPLPLGKVKILGKAFSGETTISKVELSQDSGKTWILANLAPPHSTGGWQEFDAVVDVENPGPVTFLSRATDLNGRQQPMDSEWNPAGYLRNSVGFVKLTVGEEVQSKSEVVQESSHPGKVVFDNKCRTCHAPELVESQRLTAQQWNGVVSKMETFGVQLDEDEKKVLMPYLEQYSIGKAPTQPLRVSYQSSQARLLSGRVIQVGNKKKGEGLFRENCQACHGPNGEGQLGPRLRGREIPSQDFLQTVLRGKGIMPPFKMMLKPEDIRNIQTYIR